MTFKMTMHNRAIFRVRVGSVQGTLLGPGLAMTEIGCRLTIVVADPWPVPCWAHGRWVAESRLRRGMAGRATTVIVAQAGYLLPRTGHSHLRAGGKQAAHRPTLLRLQLPAPTPPPLSVATLTSPLVQMQSTSHQIRLLCPATSSVLAFVLKGEEDLLDNVQAQGEQERRKALHYATTPSYYVPT